MYSSITTVPEAVDTAFWFIIIVSIILLVAITAIMIYFTLRYSRKRNPVPEQIEEKAWVEITWTVLPTILVLVMFWFGYEGFKLMRDVPDDAMQIKVVGRMWDWSFEYDNGKTTDKLYVPVGKNIKLNMRSIDVVHSLYIPAFRIKEDLVPEQKMDALVEAMYDVYAFDPLILINMFHLQSSETLKNLSPKLMSEIEELSRKSIGAIARIFEQGIDSGLFIDRHPVALADIFWALFSGVILWTTSKKIFNEEKDYLKDTLKIAFEVFSRGIEK